MKRFLLSASAVALLALPAIASAQGYDNQRDSRDNRSTPARSAPARQAPSSRPAARQSNGGAYRNAPAQRSFAPARPSYTLGRANQNYGSQGGPGRSPVYRASPNQPFQRPANTQAWRNLPQGQLGRGRVQQGGAGWQGNGRLADGNRGGNWNRGGQGWNGGGQGWNRGGGDGWWRGRQGFGNYEGRRDGEWFAPGWGYYRPDPYYADYSWGVGVFVPFGLRSYYVEDPYAYGLDAAPYGYRWIFLDNQMVLIDVRTGVIVQTAGAY
jgi:Ni/Co efflux regulator RcnB